MRRSRWFRVVVLLVVVASTLTLVGAGPPPGRPTPGEAAFAPGRILVKFQPGVSAAQKAAAHRAQGAHVLQVIPGIDVQVVNVPAGAERARVAAYARSPLVAYAEPDYIAQALEAPDDTFFAEQWGLHNAADTDIDWLEAWEFTGFDTGSGSIVIAILDTGIDQDHPDLDDKLLELNANFTNSRTVDDLYGHGTHVAGIAAAETNNDQGVAGVAYNSALLNVKVLNDRGSGRYSWIADGIVWAANYGANVINMSLGGYYYSETLELAVDYAWEQGVVLAAAAGNDGTSDKLYPAAYANCIAVAATDDDDQRVDEPGWWASNYGTWVDVAAPGLYIYSTIPNHDSRIWGTPDETPYDYGSGTSMATPHVAGLAALVWATEYGSSNEAVRDRIEATCDNIAGTDTDWEHGRINACKAVGGTCDEAPPVTDIAITVLSAPSSVVEGDTVQVDVTVKNVGNQDVASDIIVTLTDDTDTPSVTIGTKTISGGLPAGISTTLIFSWDTSSASLGDHTLTATAGPVADETDTADNSKSTVVTVESAITDIAISAVDAPTSVVQGDIIDVNVTVENVGNQDVSAVTVSLTDTPPGEGTAGTVTDSPQTITGGLAAGASTTLTFSWDTSGASSGDHTLTASHELTDDDASNDSKSTTVTVSEVAVAMPMHVQSIVFSSKVAGRNTFLYTTVKVVDGGGNPLAGVGVAMSLTRVEGGSWDFTGETGSDGTVVFTLRKAASGSYIATVAELTLTDYTWDTGEGVEWASCELQEDGTFVE